MAAAFSRLLPHDGTWDVMIATDDVAKAYRQVTCAQPWFTPVALRNPYTGEVEFFTMGGFNFGLATAPFQFDRVSHFLTHMCHQIGGATCTYYVDDIASADPSFAVGPLETRGDAEFQAAYLEYRGEQEPGSPPADDAPLQTARVHGRVPLLKFADEGAAASQSPPPTGAAPCAAPAAPAAPPAPAPPAPNA